jgi:hypothetical protein
MSVESFYNELEQARNGWVVIYDILVNAKYDISSPRLALNNESMEWLHRKAILVFELFFSIKPDEKQSATWTAITSRLIELRNSVQQLKTSTDSVLTQFKQYSQNGITILDTNNNFNFQFNLEDASQGSWNAVTNLSTIDSMLSQLLAQIEQLLPISNAVAVNDLTKRAEALGELVRDAQQQRDQAQNLANSAAQSALNAGEREKAIKNALTQAEEGLAKLQALNQQANSHLGSVTTLVEQIKTIGSASETLEQVVNGFQSKFDAFQKQLDDRSQQFSDFEKNTAIVFEKNSEREKEIERLMNVADAMISGATTAGLAKSMEDTRARYQNRMGGAQRGFYFAVFLLIVSAIPLAIHLFPELFKYWVPPLDGKLEEGPYSIIGKIFILLPATWLTAFFTKAYADFFHLEREYAHKAALAMSVDGFKRQAEKYEEEIVAEVFMEIRNNPAKGRPVEAASHPLYDVLAKFVGKALEKEKLEDKKK